MDIYSNKQQCKGHLAPGLQRGMRKGQTNGTGGQDKSGRCVKGHITHTGGQKRPRGA